MSVNIQLNPGSCLLNLNLSACFVLLHCQPVPPRLVSFFIDIFTVRKLLKAICSLCICIMKENSKTYLHIAICLWAMA